MKAGLRLAPEAVQASRAARVAGGLLETPRTVAGGALLGSAAGAQVGSELAGAPGEMVGGLAGGLGGGVAGGLNWSSYRNLVSKEGLGRVLAQEAPVMTATGPGQRHQPSISASTKPGGVSADRYSLDELTRRHVEVLDRSGFQPDTATLEPLSELGVGHRIVPLSYGSWDGPEPNIRVKISGDLHDARLAAAVIGDGWRQEAAGLWLPGTVDDTYNGLVLPKDSGGVWTPREFASIEESARPLGLSPQLSDDGRYIEFIDFEGKGTEYGDRVKQLSRARGIDGRRFQPITGASELIEQGDYQRILVDELRPATAQGRSVLPARAVDRLRQAFDSVYPPGSYLTGQRGDVGSAVRRAFGGGTPLQAAVQAGGAAAYGAIDPGDDQSRWESALSSGVLSLARSLGVNPRLLANAGRAAGEERAARLTADEAAARVVTGAAQVPVDLFATKSRGEAMASAADYLASTRGRVDQGLRKAVARTPVIKGWDRNVVRDTEVTPFVVKARNAIKNRTDSYEGYADHLWGRLEDAGLTIEGGLI